MKKRNLPKIFIQAAGLLSLSLLLGGCSQDTPAGPVADESAPTGLDAFFLDARPEGAIPVAQARQEAEPGEPIVVTGQIGAAVEPFSSAYAMFVLGDESLMYCDEMAEDHCPTPWDACCEDPDKVKQRRASVQLVADGTPIARSLKGVNGLQGLDRVVVVGQTAPSSTPDNLVINATGIYPVKE